MTARTSCSSRSSFAGVRAGAPTIRTDRGRSSAAIEATSGAVTSTGTSTPAPRLTFFTAFDILARPQDCVVRNGYTALRSVLAGRPVQPYAVFIGQCLPEAGDMTLDSYSECLGRALARIPAERTLYIPHPRQSAEIIERIRRDHGLDILRPPLPFELHMATTGEVPCHIASFFSSALETCSRILEGTAEVAAYRIPSELLLHNRSTTELFYRHFESRVRHGFTVVDL